MQYFRELWQSGFDARHLDELIEDSFQDFPPYAQADQQRLSFSRQYGNTMNTKVIIENNGDLLFQSRHLQLGSMLFTTTGKCEVDGSLRLSLPLNPFSSTSPEDAQPKLAFSAPQSKLDPRRRFFSSTRGAQLMYGVSQRHAILSPHLYRDSFGQLECDLDLTAPWRGRHMCGLRCGPLSARFKSVPTTSTGTDSQENSNNNLSASYPSERTGFFSRRSAYIVDLSFCIAINPLGKNHYFQNSSTPLNDPCLDKAIRDRNTEAQHESVPQGPLALTVGFRQDFTVGETLLAFAFQSDRSVMNTLRYNGCPQGLDIVPVPPPVQRSESTQVSEKVTEKRLEGENYEVKRKSYVWNHFCIPETAVQLLLIKTLAAKSHAPNTSGSLTNATLLGASGFSGNWSPLHGVNHFKNLHKPCHSLPTLVGCNISFKKQLLRLSAASMFHDKTFDFEAAMALDTTPFTPRLPTLVKLSFNNGGRVEIGITSLFYDVLSITLGVNIMRGEDMKFGIEFKA